MTKKLKGNLLVGQSGGPTAVINCSLAGIIEEAMKHEEIEGIYGAIHGIQGVLNEELIDLRKENPSVIKGLKKTPSAALASCRYKVEKEDYPRIIEIIKAHNIRYFFYIGGNDSMDTSHQIWKLTAEEGYEIRVIGVPKTIDNDLAYTDHCPGYGSVARYVAISTMDAGRDTEAIGIVDKVKILEFMGRNAGWITAASALGKKSELDAPHLIYLPERPFREEEFLASVEEIYKKLGWVVVAVCEGLKDEKGESIVASSQAIDVDAFKHKQLGGISQYLCNLVSANLKLKARCDKPGTIQRVASTYISSVDVEEAYLVGKMAVLYALDGKSNYMVTLERVEGKEYSCDTGIVKLEDVANAEKLVPHDFINEQGNFVTQKYLDYARPLIGSPLPEYVRFERHYVPKLVSYPGR